MGHWLITWEWSGDHAKVKNKIAAIINYRASHKKIAELVEFIYATKSYTLSERLNFVKDKR